jgi:hypothetical protein
VVTAMARYIKTVHMMIYYLTQIGKVTQWELDLKEEFRKKGLYD